MCVKNTLSGMDMKYGYVNWFELALVDTAANRLDMTTSQLPAPTHNAPQKKAFSPRCSHRKHLCDKV